MTSHIITLFTRQYQLSKSITYDQQYLSAIQLLYRDTKVMYPVLPSHLHPYLDHIIQTCHEMKEDVKDRIKQQQPPSQQQAQAQAQAQEQEQAQEQAQEQPPQHPQQAHQQRHDDEKHVDKIFNELDKHHKTLLHIGYTKDKIKQQPQQQPQLQAQQQPQQKQPSSSSSPPSPHHLINNPNAIANNAMMI